MNTVDSDFLNKNSKFYIFSLRYVPELVNTCQKNTSNSRLLTNCRMPITAFMVQAFETLCLLGIVVFVAA